MQSMKWKWLLAGLGGALLSGCVGSRPSADQKPAYVVEQKSQTTLRVLFDETKDDPAAQWRHALAARNAGELKKADRLLLYLVRRWPNSAEAPLAQRARADMLYARGKLADAFEVYQALIDGYSSRMVDYDGALQSQFEIAEKVMNRRRMRWVFGGYRAPEHAISYFEAVIRNGPHWSRAAEAQYRIGEAHEAAGQLEEAVVAYATLGYRYPDSSFAEAAAWREVTCLNHLQRKYPRSPEMMDRLLTSSTVFLSLYPDSEHAQRVKEMRNKLYYTKAERLFEIAEFYTRGPRPRPLDAALIYFKKMVAEYPQSKLVPAARRRIQEVEAKIRSRGNTAVERKESAHEA